MKRHAFPILIAVLLGMLLADARAQSPPATDAAAVLPWNRLKMFGEPVSFSSIAGLPGTTPVTGSSVSLPFDPPFTLPLPFEVRFLDSTYPAGYPVKVGVAGFLSFNSSISYGEAPSVLEPDGTFTRLLMPFWGELRTSGRSGQGIYQRLDTFVYDTVWTIEWRVEATRPPYPQGAFQLQITRHARVGTTISYVDYRFLYDGMSPLSYGVLPGSFGAQVGAKNLGQPEGYPPPLLPKADDPYYFLWSPSAYHPSLPSITRLPTHLNGGVYVPDWYAPWEGAVFASHFHFTLPDTTYKIKPIEIDISSVPIKVPPSVSGVPEDTIVTRPAVFENGGLEDAYNVPVAIYIYDGTTPIDSTLLMIDTITVGSRVEVQFDVPALEPGIYRSVAIARYGSDQNRSNDTASRLFYVRPDVDVMPYELLSPTLGPESRYVVDSAVSVRASILGVGTTSPTVLRYTFTIRDANDSVVATGADSLLSQTLPPDSVMPVTLGSWMPSTPGLYTVAVTATADGDELPGNDLLPSIPRADWTAFGVGPDAWEPHPIPFRVFPRTDLAVADMMLYPHVPYRTDTVVNNTPVGIFFRNNGGLDAGVIGHVMIRDSMGIVVYDESTDPLTLPGGGRARRLLFPAFAVPAAGQYCLHAWLEHGASDSVRENDTASWCFQAVLDPPAPKRALASGSTHRARLAPNPSTGVARLELEGDEPPTRVIVTDLLGGEVLRLEPRSWSTVALDLRGRAGGLYLVRVERSDGGVEVLPLVVGK